MTVYFARKEYVYSGGDAIFSIPFSYIKKEHISVLVNDEATENYTYLNNSQIQVNDTLETNDVVSIIRSTPIDSRMVVFSDTSILDKKAQNLAQEQVFDVIQEIYDNNIAFGIDVDKTLADNKADLEKAQAAYEEKLNTTMSDVLEAADKINEMDTAIQVAVDAAQSATNSAQTATDKANEATEQANIATQKAQEVSESLITKTDTDLTNLTPAGEKHFINKTQVTNAILETPNGVCTYSGNTITAKSGLKVLAPNGRNADGSLKNIEYTLASDTSKELTSAGSGLGVFFLRSLDNGQTWDIGYRSYGTQWYIQEEQPQVEHCEWYNPKTNLWKHCVSGEWSDILICPLGRVSLNEGQIISLYNYETTDLLKRSDRGEIIEWDRPNLTQSAWQLKAYNTLYIAEEDGWVLFNTHLRANANVFNNGSGGIQVYGIIDEINVYGHMVNTSWDGSGNTVTVANMHTLITKVYKGQTYKIYTHDSNGGSVVSYQLAFIPFAKKGA